VFPEREKYATNTGDFARLGNSLPEACATATLNEIPASPAIQSRRDLS
jgi:hypothetical protein